MTQNEAQQPQKPQPIRFETVTPILIREKDGALSFAKPGETIEYEKNETVKTAMLAHKFNELAMQFHRVQTVTFTNNKMLSEILSKRGVSHEETTDEASDDKKS